MVYNEEIILTFVQGHLEFCSPQVALGLISAFIKHHKVFNEEDINSVILLLSYNWPVLGGLLHNCFWHEIRNNNIIIILNRNNQPIKVYKNGNIKQKSDCIPEKV